MKIETTRLIMREVRLEDAAGMFELDANPNVRKYLGGNPLTKIEQSIKEIEWLQFQYKEYGIGRWAVIEKGTNEFVGWSGLKWITEAINNKVHYYDLGYRLCERFWGKGYAPEAALASLKYAFEELNLNRVEARIATKNEVSKYLVKSIGFQLEGTMRQDSFINDKFHDMEVYGILKKEF